MGLRILNLTFIRPSRHRATQISVWTCQVETQRMGKHCGCGSAEDGRVSAGVSTVGRFAMLQTSRNVLMQETWRTVRQCFCGIVMEPLSRTGVSMAGGRMHFCKMQEAFVWISGAIGIPMASLCIFGAVQEIGTSSGQFGTRMHCQLSDSAFLVL